MEGRGAAVGFEAVAQAQHVGAHEFVMAGRVNALVKARTVVKGVRAIFLFRLDAGSVGGGELLSVLFGMAQATSR